jgi:hypothetical protein
MTAMAVEHEIQHIHDLLFIRDLLAERGAASDELQQYDTEIAGAREKLAEAARSDCAKLAA